MTSASPAPRRAICTSSAGRPGAADGRGGGGRKATPSRSPPGRPPRRPGAARLGADQWHLRTGRPAGPLERCWESVGADADAFFVSADLTYVDGERRRRCGCRGKRAASAVAATHQLSTSLTSSRAPVRRAPELTQSHRIFSDLWFMSVT